MANHHYDVADSPDEHGIQQVWKRHRQTLRFFRLMCKLMTHHRVFGSGSSVQIRRCRSGHADWHSDSLGDVSQKPDLPVVLGLGNRLRLPGQRFSRSRIVKVPRHKVDVEVRHQISEQLVVHVARREHMLDHLRDAVNVVPVRRDLGGAQAREVRNVTLSKDDDRMATSDGVSLEVCIAHRSCVKRMT